jgi:acyl carrier protein
MQEKEIIEKLKLIVKPYVFNQEVLENLQKKTEFIRDLEINSANLVDIILDVEDEFDIEIDNESMNGMQSVGDAKAIIERKMA